jgi:AraC-like DNA-binding protein/tetratricopeptide (TPR) repeat protein
MSYVSLIRIMAIIVFVLSANTIIANAAVPDSPLAAANELRLDEIYSGVEDGDSVRTIVYRTMQKDDFGRTRIYADRMRALGEQFGDKQTVAFAAALQGTSYVYSRSADSAIVRLTEAIRLSEEADFDWGMAVACNGMGLYALNFEDMDYYQAIRHFRNGLEAAKRGGITQTYSVILANLANTYYLTGNTEGLPYALECYELGKESGNDYLAFVGSHVTGLIYFLGQDYPRALEYINAAEAIIAPHDGEAVSPYKAILTNTLHGRVLTATGDMAGAKRRFDAALSFEGQTQGDELVMTYLSYGDYYERLARHDQALHMYLTGIRLSEENDNRVYHAIFYRKISETYEALGDWANALLYNKEASKLARKQFDTEKERSINELKVQYDLEKKEAEIEYNQLQLLQQRRKMHILLLLVTLAAVGLAGTIYYYRRRNKLYLEIVRQSQKAVHATEMLNLERQESKSRHAEASQDEDEAESKKYANSSLSSQRSRELFDSLEALMTECKVYCDRELTVDKLAEMLDSNRSYISRIINEYSGNNFNGYTNKYRIDEAIRILSDINNDTPLKALAAELGFNNLTTFYNSFQKETGIPPSLYRKKVVELNRP